MGNERYIESSEELDNLYVSSLRATLYNALYKQYCHELMAKRCEFANDIRKMKYHMRKASASQMMADKFNSALSKL